MSRTNLIRWSGLTAVLAGILRVIASFTPIIASIALQIVYFTIDVLLLIGIIGIYGIQKKETGRWGFVGFMLALSGTVLLLVHDVVNAGAFLYPLAAVLFAVGISILAICAWMAKTLPHWVSAFLVISTLLGIFGYGIKGLGVLFVISGAIFGVGLIGAGITVWLLPGNHANTAASPGRSTPLRGILSLLIYLLRVRKRLQITPTNTARVTGEAPSDVDNQPALVSHYSRRDNTSL